jgi:hypothetical protein
MVDGDHCYVRYYTHSYTMPGAFTGFRGPFTAHLDTAQTRAHCDCGRNFTGDFAGRWRTLHLLRSPRWTTFARIQTLLVDHTVVGNFHLDPRYRTCYGHSYGRRTDA